MTRRGFATAVPALAAAVAVAAPAPAAGAHTHLESSAPADGARLERPPSAVELTFDDPVEPRLSTATLIGAGGRRARLALRGTPSPERLRFDLPADVPAGEVIVAYRALSTDGHPTAGAIVFASAISAPAAARAAAASRAAVARARAPAGPPAAARALAGARGLQYAAIAVLLGGALFLVLAWRPALTAVRWRREEGSLEVLLARRWHRAAAVATAAGAASAAVAFAAQTAVGEGAGAALTLDGAGLVLSTRAGTAWLLALAGWLTIALVLRATAREPGHPRALLALALPLAVLVLVPAASGHAGRDPLLAAANVVHVCAVSAWLGGLVALLLVSRAIGARGRRPAERRLLGELVARFSVVAMAAVATLAATGGAQSAMLLGGPGELLSTGYGRLLSVKIGLTLALLALGARQRHALARRWQPAAGGVFAGTARIEMLLGIVVLATTALLAGEAAHA